MNLSRQGSAAATFAVGAGIFAAAVGVGAQQPATAPTCQIKGTIVGLAVPLPGVAITARKGEVVQTATSTGVDGTYALNLPDASYQISIDLTGFDRVERELTVNRESGCPEPLDLTLTLTPRTTTQAAATGRAAGPNGGRAAGANGAQPGQPAAGRAGGQGRFETLEVTEDSDVAGVDTRTFETQSPGADSLLPPGFGSEALADAIAITGDAARVDRGQLNDRRDALNRGDFQFNDQRGGDGGFGGNPTLAGIDGGQGGGRGGRGGGNNNFQLGGRGGRQNRLQGNVNYRFSGSALNAAPRQLRSEVAGTEAPFSNHNFSTMLGGPLKIPGILPNANNTTNVRLQFGTTRGGNLFDQYATVPTDAMRAGDFSLSSATLIDPSTGTPFQDNQIPADRVSPQSLALLQYYPAANLPGTTRNYHYSTSNATTSNNISLQVQHNFSGQAAGGRGGRNGGTPAQQTNAGRAGRGQRLLTTRTNVNMTASVQYQNSQNDQLNVFTTLGGRRESMQMSVPINFQVQRGRTQHQFGVTYNHTSSETMNRFSGLIDVANSIGIQGVSQDAFAWGLPRLSFSSITGLSDVTPSKQTADRYSTQYTWRRPVGRAHSVQAGGDFRYDVTTTNTESNANGSFVFTGLYSSGGGQLGGLTGFDFADFLLGMPQQASIQYGPGETTLTGRTMGLFVQDDWRMLPNLTLQLGVRYDLLWPYVEENGQLVNLDVTPDFTGAAPVVAGEMGALSGVAYPAALIQTDTNNVSPKLAMAWRAPSSLIVNTSYEVNYNSGTYSGIARQLAQQPPFATTGTNIGSLSTALLMESALTGIPVSDTRNNYGIDKDYVLGLVQQSVINVSRDIGRAFLASANYTHTRGSNLEIVRAPNRDADGLRIEGVQPFTWTTAEGRSVLNSANFQLQKRQSSGYGYRIQYTLAKSRDNSPSIGGGGGGGGNVAQNDQDIDSEWGLSNFDQRHRLQGQVSIDLPFGQGRRFLNNGGFAAGVLDRWRVTANFSADSGRPRTVTVRGASRDIASGVNGALRADYNGLQTDISDPTIDKYFNTDAFTIPGDGAFGSSPRNIIVGPGSKNLNATIQRNVALGTNRNVTINVTINNILNLANYTGVDTNVNSPTFGQITGISGARSAQLQLQFSY